jgi:hypothetical protein
MTTTTPSTTSACRLPCTARRRTRWNRTHCLSSSERGSSSPAGRSACARRQRMTWSTTGRWSGPKR